MIGDQVTWRSHFHKHEPSEDEIGDDRQLWSPTSSPREVQNGIRDQADQISVMAFQVTVGFVANRIALDRHTFLKRVLVYEWNGHPTRDTVDRDRSLTGNTKLHPGHGGAARRLSVGK